MKKVLFIFIIFIASFTPSTHDVLATSIFFSSEEVKDNQNIELVVNLDTDDVPINSFELVVNYDPELLAFSGHSEDNSLIRFWIRPPHAGGGLYSEQKGKVYMSAIIPGGISGLYDAEKQNNLEPIPLVRLFFTPIKSGNANFYFENSKILQHDGLGTELSVKEMSKSIFVKNDTSIEGVGGQSIKENLVPEKNHTPSTSSDSIFWKILALVCILVLYGLLVDKLKRKKTSEMS